MQRQIAVRVLGRLEIQGAQVPAAKQQRLLLAALAAAAPSSVGVDRLIDGLWLNNPPVDTHKALQVLIARLRRTVLAADIKISLEPDGYVLHTGARNTDVSVFREICRAEKDLAESDYARRRKLLQEALEIFCDDAFSDLAGEALVADAAFELNLQRDLIVTKFHEVRLALGEAADLLPALTQWAHEHPFDEGSWCRLALALHRLGRPTEALRALQVHRSKVRETGVEPTSAISELEAQLLADEPDIAVTRYSGNLRVPSTLIVGRSSETDELSKQLAAGQVLTLLGAGGVGKTSLALHVAGGVEHRYRDGVWVCELAEIDSGSAVVDVLAKTLGVHQQRGKTLVQSIVSAFSDAEALVILDNCEHVLAGAVEVVIEIQRNCPKVAMFATSREQLDLASETIYLVSPLDVPDRGDGETMTSAVELFVERAGVELGRNPETDIAVAEICRQLDGLPLALELAASRVRNMPVIEMSRRLDERFKILSGKNSDRPNRHRALWDVADWSYQLLEEPTQDLFRQLSVFLGGFTVEAAAKVSGMPYSEAEDLIWSLVDQSLLSPMPGVGNTRYHMLETLRQYGHELLVRSGELRLVRNAHLSYLVEFVLAAEIGIHGGEEAIYVQRVGNEISNLRAAHKHALVNSLRREAAILVTSLHEYAEWRQFFELGSWAIETLELEGEAVAQEAALFAVAGWGLCIAGEFELAIDYARRGLDVEGDVECGWLHDVYAHCAYFQGDSKQGLTHGAVEIDRARLSDDPYRLSYVLADSGIHACLVGEVELGFRRAEEALDLAEQIGNPSVRSMAQMAMGFALEESDPESAIAWLRKSRELASSVDSNWTAAICSGELAALLALHGNPSEALELAAEQFAMFRRAADDGRARGIVRIAIPALGKILSGEPCLDLVILDAASDDRPRIREGFVDKAVTETIAAVNDLLGSDACSAAATRGRLLSDEQAFDLAHGVMSDAIRRSDP